MVAAAAQRSSKSLVPLNRGGVAAKRSGLADDLRLAAHLGVSELFSQKSNAPGREHQERRSGSNKTRPPATAARRSGSAARCRCPDLEMPLMAPGDPLPRSTGEPLGAPPRPPAARRPGSRWWARASGSPVAGRRRVLREMAGARPSARGMRYTTSATHSRAARSASARGSRERILEGRAPRPSGRGCPPGRAIIAGHPAPRKVAMRAGHRGRRSSRGVAARRAAGSAPGLFFPGPPFGARSGGGVSCSPAPSACRARFPKVSKKDAESFRARLILRAGGCRR